jgi:TPR repeat protein
MPKDPARARSLFDQACTAKEVMACATLRVAYGTQATVDPAEVALYRATYDKTCAAGEAADCTSLGILLSATGDPGGRAMMKKGCSLGDAWGCHLSK